MKPADDGARCDFCFELGPTWSYPAHDVPVDFPLPLPIVQMSRGFWAACDECHELIEAGAWASLNDRAWTNAAPEFGDEAEQLFRAYHAAAFEAFRRGRFGEAQPAIVP